MGISHTRAAAALWESARCWTPRVGGAKHERFPGFIPHLTLHPDLTHAAAAVRP